VKLVQIPARTALAAGTVALATLVPATSASAAADPGAASVVVATMAADALALVEQERALVADDAAGAELAAVDAGGAAVLDRFDQLEVDLPPAVRSTLSAMPAAGVRSTATLSGQAPPDSVYAAAIADLRRIVATPAAVLPTRPDDDGGRGDAAALAVAVTLGLALVVRSTRHDGEHDHDLDLDLGGWSDVLTGVANRRRLDHDLALTEDVDLGPTAVVLVAVDELVAVSDSFGHVTGDEVLRTVAQVVAANVREHDVVYRTAADEFCVLLLGAAPSEAGAVAERIVASAREVALPDGSHLTVSVGLAAATAGGVAEILDDADRALAEAKAAGRDRVCAATVSAG
jgi:diguanylate cyclase (GGDEF)-like protein